MEASYYIARGYHGASFWRDFLL